MPRPRSNHISWAILIEELQRQPYAMVELAEVVGIHYSTALEWIALLHRKRIVRICDYRRTNHNMIAMYEWNDMKLPDTKKPKRMTPAERTARYRAKKAALNVVNLKPTHLETKAYANAKENTHGLETIS